MDTPQVLSTEKCHKLSAFVHQRFGMFFPLERHKDLQRAVIHACEESRFSNPEAYVDWVLSGIHSDKKLEPLVTSLTIGETYFFRDPGLFTALREEIIPQRLRREPGRKMLRVWSAGCSTGEEPYSIAMLLDHYALVPKDCCIDLLATDVNVKSLSRARKGIYSRWSFRGLSEMMQQRYFKAVDEHHWQIDDSIRRRVNFSYLNLAAPPFYPGEQAALPCDVILCRNVLMYFSRELRQQILIELTKMLDEGGWLIVSPSEAGLVNVDGLHSVHINGIVLHRKGVGSVRSAVRQWTPEPLKPVKAVRKAFSTVKERPPRPSLSSTPQEKDTEQVPTLDVCTNLVEQGRYDTAKALLATVVDQGHLERRQQAQACLLTAKCHANLGEIDEAVVPLEQSLRLDQMNPAAHYLYGVIALERQEHDQARHSLERALYLDDNYIMAQLTMAMLQGQSGDKDQQKKSFERIHLLLDRLAEDAIIPDSGGMTATHLRLSLKDGDG
nr:CheR family methyltransferase [uncultured Desulfuromonas sp.]